MNTNETKNYYEQNAKTYHKLNDSNSIMKSFYQWITESKSSGILYDFGCGTGRDVSFFTEFGFDATGFDFSEKMLEVAKESNPQCNFQLFDLLNDNFSKLVSPDIIWGCASLLHLTEKDFSYVLQKLKHLLKEDGLFYLSMKMRELTKSEWKNGRFFQYYSRIDLIKRIEESGFIIVRSEENKREQDTFVSYLLKKSL